MLLRFYEILANWFKLLGHGDGLRDAEQVFEQRSSGTESTSSASKRSRTETLHVSSRCNFPDWNGPKYLNVSLLNLGPN